MDDRVILYMDPRTGHITKKTEELGEVPQELSVAKKYWEDGQVKDCNLAFQRLASFDFDMQATLKFYRDNA